MDDELEYRRRNIDRIDKTIGALMLERRRVEREIGALRDRSVADAAYQGAPGAFSEEAARELLGPDARLRPFPSLHEVFDALLAGVVGAAVVPIENSLAGAVPGCAELLERHDVRIAGECLKPIRHALVAKPGTTIEEITEVLSHPMAIKQCEGFFRARPHLLPVHAFDTAGAVELIMKDERRNVAAIASSRAAALYGAAVLCDGIQDSPDNRTRFLLLRR